MAGGKHGKLLDPGSRAPEFRLPRLDGGTAALQEIVANGPALIAFFKTTCPVCQLTLPFLERIHKAGTLPVYAISQDDAEDTREFNREFGLTLPTLLDSARSDYQASNAFGISSVPSMFLIERGGGIARVIEGWSKRDVESLGGLAGAQVFRQGENVPEWKAGLGSRAELQPTLK
jgi:peroxiredoxin